MTAATGPMQQFPTFYPERPDRWHAYVTVEPSTYERFPSLASVLHMRITGRLSVDGYDARVTVKVEPGTPAIDVRPPVVLSDCSASGAAFLERCVQTIEDTVEEHMEQTLEGAKELVR